MDISVSMSPARGTSSRKETASASTASCRIGGAIAALASRRPSGSARRRIFDPVKPQLDVPVTVNRAVVTGGSVRRRKRRALRDRLLPIVGPLILIGLWWLTSATGILNAKLVPAPGPTLVTTWNALLHG